MNFIKKIFDNKIDNLVHLQFQKFGRGKFKDRAVVNIKNLNGKFIISTNYEFANDLVKAVAEKLKGKTIVRGIIVSTNDLEGLSFKGKKQFQGIKKYIIEKEMDKEEILNLLEKFPKAFFALSFRAEENELKIKPKLPKSGKPGKKREEKPQADFCKLITRDKKIVRDFIFEKENFKKAEINHTFLINEILIPDELKEETDYAKIRENAKRKGKIIRKAIVDGEEIKSENEFVA